MRVLGWVAGLAASSLALSALAADDAAAPPPAPPKLIKGTIVSLAADVLTVKAGDGETVAASMLPNTNIVFDEMRKFSDIKQGDFIGSAAVKGADGKLHAKEVHIFPPALRGAGEGQYPWGESGSSTSMTNATVMGVSHKPSLAMSSMTNATVANASGSALKLTYHGAGETAGVCSGPAVMAAPKGGCMGDAEILVSPNVPVVALVPGDRSLLVPGKAVSLFTTKDKDGKTIALGMTVEKNGIKPIN